MDLQRRLNDARPTRGWLRIATGEHARYKGAMARNDPILRRFARITGPAAAG